MRGEEEESISKSPASLDKRGQVRKFQNGLNHYLNSPKSFAPLSVCDLSQDHHNKKEKLAVVSMRCTHTCQTHLLSVPNVDRVGSKSLKLLVQIILISLINLTN